MSLTPSTLPRSANLVHVRAPRSDRGEATLREPLARLMHLDDPAAWQAAALALMVLPGSAHEREAWAAVGAPEIEAHRQEQLLEDAFALPHAYRLPWFEHFARLLAPHPAALRHDVIDAARRVMTADGIVTPMDQLRWIGLRHLLAGSAVSPPVGAPTELDTLNDAISRHLCIFSAFLSQFVPAPEVTLDLNGGESPCQTWYARVTLPWHDRRDRHGQPFQIPPREDGRDIDASLRALRALQGLPWMMRPVLVRSWYDAARELTEGPLLHEEAADALRLACVLLDSPVPPELGRQYIEVESTRP